MRNHIVTSSAAYCSAHFYTNCPRMSLSFPSPFTWYRLSINGLPGVCLDVINDGHAHEDGKLQMAPIGNYSGQHWQFLPSPEGSYCLRTMYTGTDMFLHYNYDHDPHLTRETAKLGARWYLKNL